ncbi:TPA: hypothetical protein ACH3X2_014176 [Trebouxia sp. C0005]
MLAWMGGKRSKLKHAKKQQGPGPGRRSLQDKPAASVHRASKGKRTEHPAQAGTEGVPSKRAHTARTTAENTAATLLSRQSSSSSSCQQDRFDQLPADTAKCVPVRQASGQYCQATRCDEDTGHRCGQPEKGSVEHKPSKKPNKASVSLDLQAIELPQ